VVNTIVYAHIREHDNHNKSLSSSSSTTTISPATQSPGITISLKHLYDCFSDIIDSLLEYIRDAYEKVYTMEHDAWTRTLLEFQLETERFYQNFTSQTDISLLNLITQLCDPVKESRKSGDRDVSSPKRYVYASSEHSIAKIKEFVKTFQRNNMICYVPITHDAIIPPKEQNASANADVDERNAFVNDDVDEYGLFKPAGLQNLTKRSIIVVHGHYASARDSKFYCSTCRKWEFVRISTGQTRSADEGITAWFVCDNKSHGLLFLKKK
jgi:DNA-directed RNA polymerase subunit M/transcription elongation factor TFIIS